MLTSDSNAPRCADHFDYSMSMLLISQSRDNRWSLLPSKTWWLSHDRLDQSHQLAWLSWLCSSNDDVDEQLINHQQASWSCWLWLIDFTHHDSECLLDWWWWLTRTRSSLPQQTRLLNLLNQLIITSSSQLHRSSRLITTTQLFIDLLSWSSVIDQVDLSPSIQQTVLAQLDRWSWSSRLSGTWLDFHQRRSKSANTWRFDLLLIS